MQDNRSVMEKMFDNPPLKMGVPDANDLRCRTNVLCGVHEIGGKGWLGSLQKFCHYPQDYPEGFVSYATGFILIE